MFLESSELGMCFNTIGLCSVLYVKILSRKEERASRTSANVENWECGFENLSHRIESI